MGDIPSDFLASGSLDSAARRLRGELVGQQIGVYRITSLLGVGGMGEVYRARDTQLGREVAIKVLPPMLTADADRLVRFQREARVLASLNHPNIGGIYGFEDASGSPALILELIDGETLAELIARHAATPSTRMPQEFAPSDSEAPASGGIPVKDALKIAGQIAEALDAAHERGIVHRDLKPWNIKITPDGTVKVLDFGLAKAASHDMGATEARTHAGMILGTAAYMSPEQARGQTVDKRTDIWSFGCVLFEMLSGKPAFAGPTVSDTIAAVLDREPDWHTLPSTMPAATRRLIQRCIEKDPKHRLRDIGDARNDLGDCATHQEEAAPREIRQPTHSRYARSAVAALLFGIAAATAVNWSLGRDAPPDSPIQFSIQVPTMPNPYSIAVSPDGRTIAFSARQSSGVTMLFVRVLDSVEARVLPGTDGAVHPFWSPDSRYIGFATGSATRELKVVGLDGSAPRVLTRVSTFFGGTWSTSGVIVFSMDGGLFRIPGGGGEPVRVNLGNSGKLRPLWPHFLPDGRHFVYTAWSGTPAERAIFIASLDLVEPRRLVQSDSMAAYALPHHLLYRNQRTLFVHDFELSTLSLRGAPVAIAHDVLYNAATGRAAFSISQTGTLAYRTGQAEPSIGRRPLVWVNRDGTIVETIQNAVRAPHIRLSPDGSKVAFAEEEGGRSDLWLYDLERRQRSLLSDHPAQEHWPAWSPDGERIGFDSDRTGDHVLYEKRADRTTPETLLLQPEPATGYGLLDWTERFILFSKEKTADPHASLWALPLTGDRRPFEYFPDFQAGGNSNATLSPDARWVAFVAREAGTNQVIVQSFPDRRQHRHQVSPNGGSHPQWRGDASELFYVDSEWRMIAVPMRSERPVMEKAALLFVAPVTVINFGFLGAAYNVTADGQRFLFNPPEGSLESTSSIIVETNWRAAASTRRFVN